ncbi:polyphosphate polymerase domain-containing protein [Aureispira anguillae]|uniref:Polyphosphate polymerase domain-containing protein n=1 Tax=Aureispira anguillae TaxID=2864201 RepID=A0A916DUD5_9BACT|nr:polyphosphate polymerase domain-containing protein [Aureispira anguillae]BDS13251.1 polyphosphate polymerase domain-containing protein [Aureispira anguillae]
MRFERKYRIENLSMIHIMQIIKSHPASFYKLYPNRTVNNIYFDSPNLTCLNDNLKGINVRKKYRVRWYGTDTKKIIQPKLEVKYKENELGGKTIFDVPPFALSDLKTIQKEVNQLIPQQFSLQPTLLNSYERSYWGTKNGKFRITIDSNLRFHSLLHSPNFVKYSHRDAVVIVELKYEKEDEKDLQRISRFLPFRLSKNSKYVNGILLTQ